MFSPPPLWVMTLPLINRQSNALSIRVLFLRRRGLLPRFGVEAYLCCAVFKINSCVRAPRGTGRPPVVVGKK